MVLSFQEKTGIRLLASLVRHFATNCILGSKKEFSALCWCMLAQKNGKEGGYQTRIESKHDTSRQFAWERFVGNLMHVNLCRALSIETALGLILVGQFLIEDEVVKVAQCCLSQLSMEN
jgi:hypothetical protein